MKETFQFPFNCVKRQNEIPETCQKSNENISLLLHLFNHGTRNKYIKNMLHLFTLRASINAL